MAEQIVTARTKTAQYTLPAATRNALLENTAAARREQRAALIEKQRAAFINRHGDPFGGTEMFLLSGQTKH